MMSFKALKNATVKVACGTIFLLYSSTEAGITWQYDTFNVTNEEYNEAQADFGAEVFLISEVLIAGTLEIDRAASVTLEDSCSIMNTVLVRDNDSVFDMNGGYINHLTLQETSTVNIHSGVIDGYVEVASGGHFSMTGGTLTQSYIEARTAAHLDFSGYEFSVTGNGSTTIVERGSTYTYGGFGTLEINGQLGDGSFIDLTIDVTNATVTFDATAVPGPLGSALALTSLLVARQRRRKA